MAAPSRAAARARSSSAACSCAACAPASSGLVTAAACTRVRWRLEHVEHGARRARPGQRERPPRGAHATPEPPCDSKVLAHPAFSRGSGHQGACPTLPLSVPTWAMSMAPAAAARAAAASAAACRSAWSRCCSAASRRPTCRSAPRALAGRRQTGVKSTGQPGRMVTLRTPKEAGHPTLSTPYTKPTLVTPYSDACGPQRPTCPVSSSASVPSHTQDALRRAWGLRAVAPHLASQLLRLRLRLRRSGRVALRLLQRRSQPCDLARQHLRHRARAAACWLCVQAWEV